MSDIASRSQPERGLIGYRLVPRDLYDLMLAALRDSRVIPASPVPVPAPSVPQVARPIYDTAGPVSNALPDEVVAACEAFGFGDREEISANFRRASELWTQGHPAKSIVREIRQGADVTSLFV